MEVFSSLVLISHRQGQQTGRLQRPIEPVDAPGEHISELSQMA